MDSRLPGSLEARPDTWSVFAAFRRTRLALARHMPSLPAALAFAERLRRERFHHRDAVFVVHDQSGRQIEPEATAPVDRAGISPAGPHEGRAATSVLRAERALERARQARLRLAETFETRLTRLQTLGISQPTVLHEVAERHAQMDRDTEAAIASMEQALATLRARGYRESA